MNDLAPISRIDFRFCRFRFLSVCCAIGWIVALEAVAEASRPALDANAEEGKNVFAQSCASCHDVNTGAQLIGPGLKGYYRGHHPAPKDAEVRELIVRGKGAMPGFSSLSDAELAELVAYLKTL
jgi:mono/diheme cytochrome c family protein